MARAGQGYTYLEVFVGAAVAVVAVGLLVPATMKVRAAAARARCANHMKQVGAAFLGYHDARGHLPAGGSPAADATAVTPVAREAAGWTWAYLLLPHLGRDALYLDADPGVVLRTPVEVFLCPARRTAETSYGLAKLDYAVNGGADAEGRTGVIAPTRDPPLRLADFRGGTGGVLLFGGKRLNRAALGVSLDDDGAYATAGWGADYEVFRNAAEPPAQDVDEPGVLAPRSGFGSAHPGAFCVGFADGSVRPFRYTVDAAVWRRACYREGVHEPPPNEN